MPKKFKNHIMWECDKIEAFGRRDHLVNFAKEAGLSPDTVRKRIKNYGWPTEKALTTPATKFAKTPEEMVGKSFGDLVVEGFAGSLPVNGRGKHAWHCRCVCGNTCIVTTNALTKGKKHCGCKTSFNRSIWRQRRTDPWA